MKKKYAIIVGILLVILAAGAFAATISNDTQHTSAPANDAASSNTAEENTPAQNSAAPTNKTACGIFTQEIAKKILADTAVPDASNQDPPKDSDHVTITTCKYNLAGSSPDTSRSASLLVRTANDAEGSANDKQQFGPNKPPNAVDVAGYGDSAYWNTYFGELNILKGTTWYIINVGLPLAPERKMEDALKMAEVIKPQL